MAIKLRCKCGKVLKAPEGMVGKRAQCPGCGARMVIPAGPSQAGNSEAAAARPAQVETAPRASSAKPSPSPTQKSSVHPSRIGRRLLIGVGCAGVAGAIGVYTLFAFLPPRLPATAEARPTPESRSAESKAQETEQRASPFEQARTVRLEEIPASDDDWDVFEAEPQWGNWQTVVGGLAEEGASDRAEVAGRMVAAEEEWKAALQLTRLNAGWGDLQQAIADLFRGDALSEHFVPSGLDERRPVGPRGSFAVAPNSLRVVALQLGGDQSSDLTNEDFKLFRKLPNLRWLNLGDLQSPGLNEQAFVEVAQLEKLKRLDLSNQIVTDASLAPLVKLSQLEVLHLADTRISDVGAESIGRLRSLRDLDLRGTRISTEGLRAIGKLRNLEILGIGPTARFPTDRFDCIECLQHLSGLKRLRAATMLRCFPEWHRPGSSVVSGYEFDRQNSEWVAVNARTSEVVEVSIDKKIRRGRVVSDPDFANKILPGRRLLGYHLKNIAGMSAFRELNLATFLCTDEDLSVLATLTGLEALRIGPSPITAHGLAHVAELPRLRYLDLSQTAVRDEDLAVLADCRSLQFVLVRNTQVTQAGAEALMRLAPQLEITDQRQKEAYSYDFERNQIYVPGQTADEQYFIGWRERGIFVGPPTEKPQRPTVLLAPAPAPDPRRKRLIVFTSAGKSVWQIPD